MNDRLSRGIRNQLGLRSTNMFDKQAEDPVQQVSHQGPGDNKLGKTEDGMEDQNLSYGKAGAGQDDTEYDQNQPPAQQETGLVQNTHEGDNATVEASGMPDVSLAKTASAYRGVLRHILAK